MSGMSRTGAESSATAAKNLAHGDVYRMSSIKESQSGLLAGMSQLNGIEQRAWGIEYVLNDDITICAMRYALCSMQRAALREN